jgi:hypothetical protein
MGWTQWKIRVEHRGRDVGVLLGPFFPLAKSKYSFDCLHVQGDQRTVQPVVPGGPVGDHAVTLV